MNKRIMVTLVIGLALVVAGLVAKFIVRDWLTVDACYDGGGVYLDEIGKCSHSQTEVDRYRRNPPDR